MSVVIERPNKTSTMRQFVVNARCETKTFWATPGAFIFIVMMPVLTYAIVGLVNRNLADGVVPFGAGHLHSRERYYAAMLVFATFAASFTSTAIGMGTRRLDGRFRRLRTTAARPVPVMGALLVTWFLVAVLVDVLITVMATALFGVRLDLASMAEVIAFTLIAIVTYMALGFAVSLFFRSPEAATPLSNLIFCPLVFVSGLFYDVDLGQIGNILADLSPLKPLMSLLAGVFESSPAQASVGDVSVLCSWLLASSVVIVWRFRWTSEGEARRSRIFSRTRSADRAAE